MFQSFRVGVVALRAATNLGSPERVDGDHCSEVQTDGLWAARNGDIGGRRRQTAKASKHRGSVAARKWEADHRSIAAGHGFVWVQKGLHSVVTRRHFIHADIGPAKDSGARMLSAPARQ